MIITAKDAKKLTNINKLNILNVLVDVDTQIRLNAENGYSMLSYPIDDSEIRDTVLTELQRAGYQTRLLSDRMIEISWN